MRKTDSRRRMGWVVAGLLISLCFALTPKRSDGQAIVEYGKQLGGLKEPRPNIGRIDPTMRGTSRKAVNPNRESEGLKEPSDASLPSALSVKADGARLYSRQDEQSEVVSRLEPGEKLFLVGKALGSAESWYMVRTEKGAMGWVKASNVSESGGAKR